MTLIDAWGPAHSRASSGGESRMTRAAYGKDDDLHAHGARTRLPQWKALSAIAGLPIFIPAGILFFFPTEEHYVLDSIAAHRKLGLPTELLTGPRWRGASR